MRARRLLADLPRRALNFDPHALAHARSADGWGTTDLCQHLPDEPAGPPIEGGSWEIARRLMRSYAFADPSIVRAYYAAAAPLEGRNMVLRLTALGLVSVYVGVRVGEVYERTMRVDGDPVRIWGWNYRTLEGHVEAGQMDWQVWKWLQAGRVEFRVHAVSRRATVGNPVVALGYLVLAPRERAAFLESTKLRMRTFVELALAQEERREPLRRAAVELTARHSAHDEPAHDELARSIQSRGAKRLR